MGWAAIGGASVSIGAAIGAALGIWGASSHLWGDDYFLAGFALACLLMTIGVYVLIAEFFGGVGPLRFPLPPTRHERDEADRGVEAALASADDDRARITREIAEPLSPPERRRIAGETESRLASSIHDDTLRMFDRGKEPGFQPKPSPPALADELSLCKERGISIRRNIDPPTGYAASSISVLNQTMPALGEQSVRSWSMSVRAHLERHAPRFLVIFDDGPDLRPPHLFAVLVATTNRAELLAFLDHKLGALDRIIRTIVEDAAIR